MVFVVAALIVVAPCAFMIAGVVAGCGTGKRALAAGIEEADARSLRGWGGITAVCSVFSWTCVTLVIGTGAMSVAYLGATNFSVS